ncbi:PHD finger protein 10 [Portunus trituberculatus]|uniref:PHD finger protein 10 n=1 Tax=Portunus trituberculatus TaxID=210409 RepID=A0A5B7E227_PORTR|nr:PHD finger protein 10 [Portunus trituberculatus]
MNADETDLNKLEETEAAVMSLLASEADNDEAIEQSQALLTVSESYSGIGESDEFPVKEASSRTSPQDSESGLVDAPFNESTVKLSEGLSSLVSYSSSSAEVSASEDNGQDDPENNVGKAAPRVEGTVEFVEATESGSEKLPEEVQQESSLVSPGEVLAAAADALAGAADIEQVHVEEAEAVDNMAAALVKASSGMTLTTDLASMDGEEPAIPEVMKNDQEEKGKVQTPVLPEEGSVTQAHPAQEGETSTVVCTQKSKGEVENLESLAKENVKEELVTASDEKTQDAKKDEVDFKKKELMPHGKDVSKGKGIKRSLEEDTKEPAESHEIQEEKRLRKSEQTRSPSPQPQVEREEQEEEQDMLQEEEAEPMETEATQELEQESNTKTQPFDLSGIAKGDDGSHEGEGEEVGEDEGEKKDNDIQEKDKDDGKEDEESSTPSRKRKKKKRSYERPRGEGGKFMKEKPDPSMLDEETRMDYSLLQDEDSQGSASRREVRRFRCEVIVPESTEVFTAEKVVEYVWPLEGVGEHYFIQEQISQYLGIMSFKRRYPDLRRRPIDMQERDYLKEKGLVSDMACDLVNYSMANIDKSKMQEYGRKAAADAARWNANFNKEKREERRYSFDLQTFTLQMPVGRGKKLPSEYTKIGFYPVAVLPGQFTNHYREYSSQALKTMPLTTIMSAPVIADQLGSDGGSSDSEDETCDTQRTVLDDNGKEEKGGDGPRCKVCNGTKNRNKGGKPEPLIICGSCKSASESMINHKASFVNIMLELSCKLQNLSGFIISGAIY